MSAFNPLDAIRVLRSAGGELLDQAGLHGQLAQIELEEELNRLLTLLAISLLGVAALQCFVLFAGALILAAVWDTPYRLPAAAALVIVSGAATAVAWRRFKACSALGGQIFAASREELAADARLLKENL